MSTFVGHFALSPGERKKRERKYSRGEERKGQGRNGIEETEEIERFPSTLTCYKYSRSCLSVSHSRSSVITDNDQS